MIEFLAVVVEPGGQARKVVWELSGDAANQEAQQLRQMQRAVGGMVDCIPLSSGIDMWVNGEGLIIQQPHNAVATLIAHASGCRKGAGQQLVGPVVLTGRSGDGWTLPLSDSSTEILLTLAVACGGTR